MSAQDRLKAIAHAAYVERSTHRPATARALGVFPSLIGLSRQTRAALRDLEAGDIERARERLTEAIGFVDDDTAAHGHELRAIAREVAELAERTWRDGETGACGACGKGGVVLPDGGPDHAPDCALEALRRALVDSDA